MNDKELKALLSRIADGEKSALSTLYVEMEKPLYRFINLKLNDPFQSADILHEVFLDIWKGAGKFEGRSAAKTWMFGIAYRKVMDVFRKGARVDVTDDLPEQVDDSPDAASTLAAAQQAEHVRFCLDGLKPEHRSAVELAFYEDMSYREIAEVTDVPEGTVKTRVFHAKKLLLHCLQTRLKSGVVS